MGGKIFDFSDKLRRIGKVLFRGLICGSFMFTLVILFQYEKIANYYILVVVFFTVIDFPLLFTKCSLLDILSGTKYIDTLRKEDWEGKNKYEIKKN